MTEAVIVRGLTKSYGANRVLNGVNFTVRKGEIFGLLGVDGAGKTTALECAEGLRSYDGGQIIINGSVGIQLQSASLQACIKPLEAVNLFAKWNKTSPDKAMLESLGIYEFASKKYADLSTGQKRRLHLALALIADPDIIFLDEPSAGLDVEGRICLHERILALKAQGKTVILASHDMAEVEALCDRITILRDGVAAFTGTIGELTKKFGRHYAVHILTAAGEDSFETDDISGTLAKKIAEYAADNVEILGVRTDRGTLEQHFMNIARGGEV